MRFTVDNLANNIGDNSAYNSTGNGADNSAGNSADNGTGNSAECTAGGEVATTTQAQERELCTYLYSRHTDSATDRTEQSINQSSTSVYANSYEPGVIPNRAGYSLSS